jgi:ER degradation enhancer, mannosidase alpha-like 2
LLHLLLAHHPLAYSHDQLTRYDAKGGLLTLALDLGRRLLPALQTESGIPFGSINLRRGVSPTETPVTCTAAAGTLLLEFGLLSRLTGGRSLEALDPSSDPNHAPGLTTDPTSDPGPDSEPGPERGPDADAGSPGNRTFEDAAHTSAVALWGRRSELDLLGAHINLRTGAWTQQDAGIGRGVDSFYEYMLKVSRVEWSSAHSEREPWPLCPRRLIARSPPSAARAVLQAHMLFGGARGDEYLAMFHDSYHAAIRHLKHGSWYIDAHMDSAQAHLLPCRCTAVLEAVLPPNPSSHPTRPSPLTVDCSPWLSAAGCNPMSPCHRR